MLVQLRAHTVRRSVPGLCRAGVLVLSVMIMMIMMIMIMVVMIIVVLPVAAGSSALITTVHRPHPGLPSSSL